MAFFRRWRAAAAALFAPELKKVLEVEVEGLQLKLVEAKMQQIAAMARVQELQTQIHYLTMAQEALQETGIEGDGDILVRMDQETFADFAARRPPSTGRKQ